MTLYTKRFILSRPGLELQVYLFFFLNDFYKIPDEVSIFTLSIPQCKHNYIFLSPRPSLKTVLYNKISQFSSLLKRFQF